MDYSSLRAESPCLTGTARCGPARRGGVAAGTGPLRPFGCSRDVYVISHSDSSDEDEGENQSESLHSPHPPTFGQQAERTRRVSSSLADMVLRLFSLLFMGTK